MFDVTIDFDRSHLVFPTLIAILLALLGIAILITRRHAIAAAFQRRPLWPAGTDQLRFSGSLVLILIYFLALPRVGNVFPNTGLGFVICSIPFLMALSLLYMHVRSPRNLIVAAIVAVAAPLLVWSVLARLFNITLP